MNLPTNWSWQSLNAIYIRESGMESKPFLSKEFAWANWTRHGFTEAELVQTLQYLRREVKATRRKPACLSFRTLIEQPENFEHELSLAKEELLRRKPTPTPRERILASVGMSKPQPERVQPVGDIIAGGSAFEKFREAMKAEGLL